MNIQMIKEHIAHNMNVPVPAVLFTRQTDEQGQPTEWLSHWDNENRIRISLHQDVLEKIKESPKKLGLAVKKAVIEAKDDRAAYTRFTIITPNVEAAF